MRAILAVFAVQKSIFNTLLVYRQLQATRRNGCFPGFRIFSGLNLWLHTASAVRYPLGERLGRILTTTCAGSLIKLGVKLVSDEIDEFLTLPGQNAAIKVIETIASLFTDLTPEAKERLASNVTFGCFILAAVAITAKAVRR